jgi:hypothetical protein
LIENYWKAHEAMTAAAKKLSAAERQGPVKEKAADREFGRTCSDLAKALKKVVKTPPRTLDGILALLEFQRQLWNKDSRAIEAAHLSHLCESVEKALLWAKENI